MAAMEASGVQAERPLLVRAQTAIEQGRWQDAEQALRSALRSNPRDLGALSLLGVVLDKQRRFDDAEQCYKKALARYPASSSLLNNLGNHYLARAMPEQARDAFIRAVAVEPHHVNANLQLAELSLGRREARAALRFLQQLPLDQRVKPIPQIFRAQALYETGQQLDGLAALRTLKLAAASDPPLAFSVARVLYKWDRFEEAEAVLKEVLKIAPSDFDILFNLGQSALAGGHADRAREAFDAALKQKPEDELARRERAFVLTLLGAAGRSELSNLEQYVEKHPDDAKGLYELAVAEGPADRDRALAHLSSALRNAPQLLEARFLRGVLRLQAGFAAAALSDLQFCVDRKPGDARVLDQIGAAYIALREYTQAEQKLKKAFALDPDNISIVAHYIRTLQALQRNRELAVLLPALAQRNATGRRAPHQSRPDRPFPPDHHASGSAALELAGVAGRRDPAALLVEAQSLLRGGHVAQALTDFQTVRGLTRDAGLLSSAGRTLLQYGQYRAALEVLEPVCSSEAPRVSDRLDCAFAAFKTKGPEAGLAALDRMPAEQRGGDYHLMRAQMLDSLGDTGAAAGALNLGFQSAPTRADLYVEAAHFLLKHERYGESLRLLQQAEKVVPDSPELQITSAVALEMTGRFDDASKVLERLEARWPQWTMPYLVHGIMLESHLRSREAKPLLELAIAIGIREAAAWYYLASAIRHTSPEETSSARQAISKALELSPDDPFAYLLAGKLASDGKDIEAAIRCFKKAVGLAPDLVEAHYSLAAAYRAAGHNEDARSEAAEVRRIKAADPHSDENAGPRVRNLLFAVRPLAVGAEAESLR